MRPPPARPAAAEASLRGRLEFWAVLLLGALTLGAFGLALRVRWFGRRDRPREAGHLIVLGARVHPKGTPSPALVRRAARAAEAWRAAPQLSLILSGGSPDARPTEAATLARLLEAAGVPRAQLHLEEESRSTRDNARHCAAWLRARGVEDVNVLSDRFHLFRARRLFAREGLKVGVMGAEPGAMPRAERLYWVLREGLALLG